MKDLLDMIARSEGKDILEFTSEDIDMVSKGFAGFKNFFRKNATFFAIYQKDPKAAVDKFPHRNVGYLKDVLIMNIDWDYIASYKEMDIRFIETYEDRLDWGLLSLNKNIITDEFIERFDDRIDFNNIATLRQLPEEMLEKYSDRIFKSVLYKEQKLSERFLEKNIRKQGDLPFICQFQELSLKFINKYEKIIIWNRLSWNETLSKEIINAYADKLDWRGLIRKRTIDFDMVMENLEYIDLEYCLRKLGDEMSKEQRETLKELIQVQKGFGG